MKIWFLTCENVTAFVDVAVGGGPGDVAIAAELCDVTLAAKPVRHHDRLPKRGQRSTVVRSAAQSAFLVQESGEVVNGCAGGTRMLAHPSDPSEGVLGEEEIELNLPLIIGIISAIAAVVQMFIDQV